MSIPSSLTSEVIKARPDENSLYATWKAALDEKESRERLNDLVQALQRHAGAVVWTILHEQNQELAQEAVQQAILKEHTFRGEAKFSTWFQRIVTTTCYGVLRERKRRSEVPLSELVELGVESEVESQILTSERLARLTPRQRSLVSLKEAGMTDQEIADTLGLSRVYVSKVFGKIRRALEKENGKGAE